MQRFKGMLSVIRTHLTYIANAKKSCYMKQQSGKESAPQLAIDVYVCQTVQLLHEIFSAMAESWKKLKNSNVFSLFIVCLN